MFLDASVLIAALVGEAEADAIKLAMFEVDDAATSPLAMFEASCRVARLHNITIAQARTVIGNFMHIARVNLLAIDHRVGDEAHACASRYHHMTGHAARLNMGDCFAYAAAKTSGLKLAYKGNDFVHTDIDGVRFGP